MAIPQFVPGVVLTAAELNVMLDRLEPTTGTYTPTLIGFVVGTGGGALNTASWTFATGTTGLGILVVEGKIVLGTSGASVTTTTAMSLPVGFTVPDVIITRKVGDAKLAGLDGSVWHHDATNVRLVATNTAGTYASAVGLSNVIPVTWAAGHEILYQYVLRALRT